jgi:Protein of unknown function (DUF1549)/Protein of unknown function (DUF1553)/Concanavalin A-like lectin/glucanases superfamily/Planctomycete cytochrome C
MCSLVKSKGKRELIIYMVMKRLICLIVLSCGVLFYWCANRVAADAKIDFNRDIRPILSNNCFQCHGPDEGSRMAKLRFDTKEGAFAKTGVIVPGDAAKSRLLKRVITTDPDMIMPPPATGHKLTETQIKLLKQWIDEGATWGSHWAFIAPQPIGLAALPQVKNKAWVRNPIDAFVLARLEKEGLTPSPEADRATLLRRVSFDLTGLPPTLTELDDFLNDKSPNAYEKVVDRLLASPRYGERMAFKWLDAARYADTNGYQVDGERTMWRWRDYVIESFNVNKPFDQFVIEQLAGDLLPNSTLEQKIATGFNRNHRLNAEGGIVPEEYRIEYVVDRVDTTSTVFMGLTMGCARCHTHKYDPLTHKEFYQFSAFFNNIDEDGHSFDQGNAPPLMHAPTREQQSRLAQFDQDVTQSETALKALLSKHAAAQRRWEKSLQPKQQWFPDDKLIVHVPLDENAPAVFNQSDRDYHDKYNRGKDDPEVKFETGWRNGQPRYEASPLGTGVTFDQQVYFDGGMHADFRYKSTSRDYRERFTIAAWVKADNEQAGTIVSKVSDSAAEVENGVPRAEGYGLYVVNGKLHFNLVFRWGEDTLRTETVEKLPLNQWQHVAVVFDGLEQWERRLRIYVNGTEAKLKFNQRSFFLLMGGSKNTLKVGAGGGPRFRFKGALDDVRLYTRAFDADEVALLANAESLHKIASIAPAERTATQTAKLQRAFLAQAAPVDLRQAVQQFVSLKQQRQAFIDDLPTTMVMAELPTPRPAHLLRRGAYDAPAEQVERAVPAVLPPMPSDLPRNRLGLARWLTSKEHPLTARVTVNRFWQMLFGVGLVKTAEDFGAQGELPSHPELLDWLAVEFMNGEEVRPRPRGQLSNSTTLNATDEVAKPAREGAGAPRWDVKALLKTIVMSATYRQSSQRNPQFEDLENRLLARGPRTRLSVEMIRDQALLVSGLLVEKLGGPSVKPYQPEGIYKDMGFGGLTGYDQAKGEGLWRRSLYTYWKRTLLSPTMSAFDASTREFCTVKETRTNTPLQSLNLMNDVTYIEAARLLAERMLVEGGPKNSDDAATRLAWGFRVVTSRLPSAAEQQVLLRNLQKQQTYFAAQPDEARKLLTTGERRNRAKLPANEVAAYAMVASLLLNTDEAITKQ